MTASLKRIDPTGADNAGGATHNTKSATEGRYAAGQHGQRYASRREGERSTQSGSPTPAHPAVRTPQSVNRNEVLPTVLLGEHPQ